jgi:hypothetical protein
MTRSTSAASLGQRRRGGVGVVGERDGRVRAEPGQSGQAGLVASGADDPPGAEPLGDLDGHLSGVAGGAEDQHRLPDLDRDTPAQRDPGRHGRVHPGGDLHNVRVVGQRDAVPAVDDGPGGHRADQFVVGDEVHQAAVRTPTDAVDSGHQRQLPGARVVAARRTGAHPGVQAHGEDVDDLLVLVGRRGQIEGLVAGRGAERADDGGVDVHERSPRIGCRAQGTGREGFSRRRERFST